MAREQIERAFCKTKMPNQLFTSIRFAGLSFLLMIFLKLCLTQVQEVKVEVREMSHLSHHQNKSIHDSWRNEAQLFIGDSRYFSINKENKVMKFFSDTAKNRNGKSSNQIDSAVGPSAVVWIKHADIGLGNCLAGVTCAIIDSIQTNRLLYISSRIFEKFCALVACSLDVLELG